MDFLMILCEAIIYYSPNTRGHNCPQSGAMLASNYESWHQRYNHKYTRGIQKVRGKVLPNFHGKFPFSVHVLN